MATYPALAKIDSTPEQDLGLQIAFKRDANEQRTTAQSPEEYLAQFVIAKLEDFQVANVTGEQLDRIFQAEKIAFSNNDFTVLQQVAALLGVSLVIDVPGDVKGATTDVAATKA